MGLSPVNQPPVVRAVSGEVDPPAVHRGAREDVDVSLKVAWRVDDVHRPVTEVVEGLCERA